MTERLLVDLLRRRGDEFLDAWTEVIFREPLAHYREQTPERVHRWVERALAAIVDALSHDSPAPLAEYGRRLGEQRQKLGFEIGEVLDALLSSKQALVPLVAEELASEPQRAVTVMTAYASAMRRIVCAFAGVFTDIMRQQQKRMTALEERQRVARDLHDSVTQSLYAANMYGGAVKRLLAAGKVEQAHEHLADLRETTGQALREMRLLIFDLRTTDLLADGLVAAIAGRLAAVEGRADIATELRAADIPPLPHDVEEALFGIAREALNNALKHAESGRVEVEISIAEGVLTLAVRDDGRGFDVVNGWHQGGLGLGGMKERAEALGGTLEVTSAAGTGTTIRVSLPAPEIGVEPCRFA